MVVHLKKLCVGIQSAQQLRDFVEHRSDSVHTTRNFPKRKDEVLDGGSLYWIIKGSFALRQPIVDLVPWTNTEGGRFCRIILARELIEVRADKHRPFQGWRYLEVDNAPPDTHIDSHGRVLPADLSSALDALGITA